MALSKAIFRMDMLAPEGKWMKEASESPAVISLPSAQGREDQVLVDALQSILQRTPEETLASLFSLNAKEKRVATAKYFVEENYPHVARRLEQLRNFKMPEGQENAIGAAFDHAYWVLYQIAKMALGRRIILSEPLTFGTPDNGVQYEWRRGNHQFHLEIIPTEVGPRYGYLLWPSLNLEDGEEGEFDGSIDTSGVIKKFLGWTEEGLI